MAEPKIKFRQNDGSNYPEWETIPMSEIFTEISEKNHPELPVLSVQQGVGTILRDSSDRNILYDKKNLSGYKAMKKDDFIIHLRSFEGGLECSNYDGISSPAYRILRPNRILSGAYRDYFRSDDFINNKLAVSVVGIRDGKNIDMDTFWQILITVPCLEEQQKIADFLGDVDTLIKTSEQELLKLKELKKGCLQKMFPRGDADVPEVRFPGFTGAWERRKLGDVLEDLYNGQTPSRLNANYWNGKINWLSSGELNRGRVYSSIETITEEGQKSANLRIIPRGTFVMAITGLEAAGTRGNCAILEFDTTVNQSCMALFPKKDVLTTEYLFQWYQLVGEEYGLRFTQGTKQQSYNADIVSKLEICLPRIDEQRKLSDFLEIIDNLIALQKRECEKYKELKKGLLQQMFV